MERKIKFSLGEFYHLFGRGVEKRTIFLDDSDKNRFVKLLFACNSERAVTFRSIKNQDLSKIERGETIVSIGAYCLMPNHFHLLVKEKKEGGTSRFMQKILTAYSMYFNKKYKRFGSLLGGKFKAVHANNDEYLKYLFSYIHLNPVKMINPDWKEKGISNEEEVRNYLKTYRYSSYTDYLGQTRPENAIIEKSAFPEYFESYKDFEDFIKDWLDFQKGDFEETR